MFADIAVVIKASSITGINIPQLFGKADGTVLLFFHYFTFDLFSSPAVLMQKSQVWLWRREHFGGEQISFQLLCDANVFPQRDRLLPTFSMQIAPTHLTVTMDGRDGVITQDANHSSGSSPHRRCLLGVQAGQTG